MDEMTQVKQLLADKLEPDRQHLAPLRASLLEEARRPPTRRFAGSLRLAVAGVAVTAVTAGTVIFLQGAAPASAQEVLRQAAEAAQEQRDLTPGPDQYVHTLFQQQQIQVQNGKGELVNRVQERWEPAAGPKPWLLRERETSRADVPGMPRATFPHTTEVSDSVFKTDCEQAPSGELTYAGMAGITPDQMRKKVAAGGPDIWNTVSMLIRAAAVRPSVTPELYKIAAEVKGIKLIPETVDAIGRPGIGVTLEKNGARSIMIFDRETYRYLGERFEVLDPKKFAVAGLDLDEKTANNPKLRLITVNSSALVAVNVADGLPRLSANAATSKIPC